MPNDKNELIINDDALDQGITFSFKYLDHPHKKFEYPQKEKKYHNKFFKTLEEVSRLTKRNIMYTHREKYCYHHIKFGIHDVSEAHFPDKICKKNPPAAQFAIGKNLGRLHGFWIGATFHIVWIDRDHKLYKKKK